MKGIGREQGNVAVLVDDDTLLAGEGKGRGSLLVKSSFARADFPDMSCLPAFTKRRHCTGIILQTAQEGSNQPLPEVF